MEHLNTPAWKLNEQAGLLKRNLDTIQYGPERLGQIKTELGLIALELISRQLENQDLDPGSCLAFMGVDYFGFSAESKGLELTRASVQITRKTVDEAA